MNITDVFESDLCTRANKVTAVIDLGALVRNYNKICERVSCREGIICVIKADAYGHGAVRSMFALMSAGARFFAVSSVAEAIELRRALWENSVNDKIDILILGYSRPDDVDLICKYDIIQTVFSLDYAREIDAACKRKLGYDAHVRVHIKIDTGMNRLGFSTHGDIGEIRQALSMSAISAEGIFSHLACADDLGNDMTDNQCRRFADTVNALEDEGICPPMKHILNSAGLLTLDKYMYDGVRPGIILYGLVPSGDFDTDTFEAVMSLKSEVAHVHTIECGESVSYGARFTARKKTRVATIPVGYADGFIRAYSGASIRINGQECPIIGRICMDQFMVDVTDVDVSAGDTAVLFETSKDIHKLAGLAQTIDYEVTCGISKRVPRVYIENERKLNQ